MDIFKTVCIFIAVLFLSFSIFSTSKEVEQTDYPSGDETVMESNQNKSASRSKQKFEYDKTYGPSPIFTIGGGFSASPGGWALTSRLDIPYKDDLYFGPVGQYVKGDDQTLVAVTGNVKKLLPSTDPKLFPSIEAGLGVLIDDEDNDNDDNDSSFLTVVGGGVDYVISDNVSLGVHAYINNSFDMDHKEFFFTALAGLIIRLY